VVKTVYAGVVKVLKSYTRVKVYIGLPK